MDEALRQAVLAAGGIRALGRMLGTSHQAILQWDRVPAPRVLEVERRTGISRQVLRPDLYPAEAEVDAYVQALKDAGSGPMTGVIIEAKTRTPGKAMKPETLRRAVEQAVDRALRVLLEAHPEAIPARWRKSAEKHLNGFLFDEMAKAMGMGMGGTSRVPKKGPRPPK